MMRRGSIGRTATLILFGYQGLIAAAATAFGAWIVFSAATCPSDCRAQPEAGLVLGIVVAVGFVWLAQTLVVCAAIVSLLYVTYTRPSRGVALTTVIVEGLLIVPAIRFMDLMVGIGIPELGRYAVAAAIGAALVVVLLSALELFASDS